MTIHGEIAEIIRGHLRHDQTDLQIAAAAAEIRRALATEMEWARTMQENAVRRALVAGGQSPAAIISVTGLSEDDLTRITTV